MPRLTPRNASKNLSRQGRGFFARGAGSVDVVPNQSVAMAAPQTGTPLLDPSLAPQQLSAADGVEPPGCQCGHDIRDHQEVESEVVHQGVVGEPEGDGDVRSGPGEGEGVGQRLL